VRDLQGLGEYLLHLRELPTMLPRSPGKPVPAEPVCILDHSALRGGALNQATCALRRTGFVQDQKAPARDRLSAFRRCPKALNSITGGQAARASIP